MWKYVSRRIRETFERSANHFEKRSTTGVANSGGNFTDEKNKRSAPPCCWFTSRKCWNSFHSENDTNSKRWNFEHLNRSWIGAITWSSAVVFGWYTSQLIHLKHKYHSKDSKRRCPSIYNLCTALYPYVAHVKKETVDFNSTTKIEEVIGKFTPIVHLISNEQNGENNAGSGGTSASSTTPDSSSELGDVLNSIENKLGLAAIENGHHQDGLNLLRSAANRNHAPALYNLGLCYEMGLGVPINEKMSMELYKSAAALEHPGALYNLGIYYGQGRGGLARDTATATRLLRLAAVQGQQDAINALKTLEEDVAYETHQNDIRIPQSNDTGNSESWLYSAFAQNDGFIPTQTTLFVDNVNLTHTQTREGTVY